MGTPPPLPEPIRGLRLDERSPSITTLIDTVKAVSTASIGSACGADHITAVQEDVQGLLMSRFSGFAADSPNVCARLQSSPFAVVTCDNQTSCVVRASPVALAEVGESQPPVKCVWAVSHATEQDALPKCSQPSISISTYESGLASYHGNMDGHSVVTAATPHGDNAADGLAALPRTKYRAEPTAECNSQQLAAPTSPHCWSPSSFNGHWEYANASSHSQQSPRVSDSTALALPLHLPSPVSANLLLTDTIARGIPVDLPMAARTIEGLSQRAQRRLQSQLSGIVHSLLPDLLPSLMPAAVAAALPATKTIAATSLSLNAVLPALLEAALPPALSVVLPKAISAAIGAMLLAPLDTQLRPVVASASTLTSQYGEMAAATSAAAPGEQEQQCAAEAQLVRMLFGADGSDVSMQQQQPSSKVVAVTPGVLNVTAANDSDSSSPTSSTLASRAVSPPSIGSPCERNNSRPPTIRRNTVEMPAVVGPSALRRPSLAAFASANAGSGAGASLSTVTADTYSRRLSDTNPGSLTAPAMSKVRPALSDPASVNGKSGHGVTPNGLGQQQLYCRSSGGSAGGGGSLGHIEADGLSSSIDDALSTCSGGDVMSPYAELCVGGASAMGTGAAVNSSANSAKLILNGSDIDATGTDGTACASHLYGICGDALLDRLHQVQLSQQEQQLQQQLQQQRQQHNIASPAELLMAAASGGGPACAVLKGQQALPSHSTQSANAASFMQQRQQQQRQQQQRQQQQRQQQQRQQQQQQQEAETASVQQQLQQLQVLMASRSLSEQDIMLPASPPLSTATAAGGVQWRRSSGTEGTFATSAADIWQAADADALGFAAAAQLALGQQRQQQQQQQQQQQHLLVHSLAVVAAANAAGRTVRPEDFLAFAGPGAAGLSSRTTAAQLVAAAAAGGTTATSAGDLATYMDTALRRMLLVSPQVASELARACSAFTGAHAQLHHLCCVITEQLLDVAAMAPEVAAALLRALAAHRSRGAQATDLDPRVMGRILQLLRAGPAGRQLCLVSLEQWVDGLSRIHKRRAYLDTILHNYQLTLKRLVQAMGHQVHAVNMSLPRQLLNDLAPRALLMLTAELAPYPLLQPRRWSEEIIWTVTQMHAMGIDMTAAGIAATVAAGTVQSPISAFQWEIRRALAATAEDITAAGGQSPPGSAAAGPLAGLCPSSASSGTGATTPGGTAVPWAAHAALHRHLLLGLRRVQSRFFSDRLCKVHGLYGEFVEALLRSMPQDVLVAEREVVVLVVVLLMLECRMRPEDFDPAFGRDLQRSLAVTSAEEVAARLRCGLVSDSPLRLDPHKSRALSQLLKLGSLPGAPGHF